MDSDNNNLNNNDIMDIVVPTRIGHCEYLVEYYGALHGDVS